MKTIIKKLDIPTGKRIIVISDIHGHYEYLKKLLEKVNFNEDDVLFIVGDIIEKGSESLKTLRFVMDLCNTYMVYPLMGNVEAWRLEMFDDDSENGYKNLYNSICSSTKRFGNCLYNEMCEALNININSVDDIPFIREQLQNDFTQEFEFLHSLPTIIETQKFIFVHGGIPTDNVDSLIDMNAFDFMKNDTFIEKGISFDKYVIVGHFPVTLYNDKIYAHNPIIDRIKKTISIDGGCGLKLDGQLNALIIPDIDSEEFTHVAFDSFPVVIAQTQQNASNDSINIRYVDNKIKILENGNEFSHAEHISTGYCLWIHNDYISKNMDYTDDYTDYRLPVEIGDKLSIIKETSKGYLMKKDGVVGWYYGEILK